MIRILSLMSGFSLALVLASFAGLAAAQEEDLAMVVDEAPTPRIVEIATNDFQYEPKTLTVPAGATTFSVRNIGFTDHNFAIETSPGSFIAASRNIPMRGTTTLDVVLTPGTYTIVCTLPAHREAGMMGTLTVTP
jgi:plastocyanin